MGGRKTLAEDLWAYGEDDLAVRARELSDQDFERVQVLAGDLLGDERYVTPSGASMLLTKACALAAVEVMEGKHRVLRRQRRRSVPKRHRGIPRPERKGLPGRLSDEKPRDVYLAACAEVASRFDRLGFKYVKSGPRMSRTKGEFTFWVTFSSSPWNAAGRSVGLQLSTANVWSKRLKQWRIDQGDTPPQGDWVAGGLLGNLGVDPRRTEAPAWRRLAARLATGTNAGEAIRSFLTMGRFDSWDIDDPNRRADVLDLVESRINQVALPYLDRFEDHDRLVEQLSREIIPSFRALDAVQWLLSHGERETALAHGRLALRKDDFKDRYERALADVRSGRQRLVDLDRGFDPTGLAYASVLHGLDF
jgi:hypothetical protein